MDGVSKGVKVVTRQFGPYKRTERSITIRRPTKTQQRSEFLRETVRAAGAGKIAIAAGAGVAGSEFARKERNKAKRAADRTLEVVGIKDEEKKPVKKAFDIDDILASGISKEYSADLVEVRKMLLNSGTLGGLSQLFNRGKQAVTQGYQSGGISGALNAGSDFAQQTGRKGLREAAERSANARLGGPPPSSVAASPGAQARGWTDATNTDFSQQLARQVAPQNPASQISSNIPDAAKDNAGKIGAGVAGAGALAGGAYLGGKWLKKKAKKYAAIGAAGLGGTALAGGAIGGAITS